MSDQPQPGQQPHTVVNVTMTNTNEATAAAVASAKAAPKEWVPPGQTRPGKSIVLAYLYFTLAGYLGWHRFYLGRPRGVWLVLFWVLLAAAPGAADARVLLGPAALLCLDFFSIPRWVRRFNANSGLLPVGAATVRRAPLLRGLGWRKAPHPSAHAVPTPVPTPLVQASAAVPSQAQQSSSPREHSLPAEHHAPSKDLRTLLLREAFRGDGKLTVTQAVMATGEDWERVEGCLRDMVQAGYVDIDNEPHSGVIVYVFPELVGRPGTPAADEGSSGMSSSFV